MHFHSRSAFECSQEASWKLAPIRFEEQLPLQVLANRADPEAAGLRHAQESVLCRPTRQSLDHDLRFVWRDMRAQSTGRCPALQ